VTKPDLAGPRLVRTYAVLTALTPLVPVPILDDVLRGYFRRRLVRGLASARQVRLEGADVHALADERGGGCLTGCLVTPVVYGLKVVFRKIFFFLEWKRAIDTASETYHFGSLLDHALGQGWCAPRGPVAAARLRTAIDAVLARRGTSPFDAVIRETFNRSKGAVLSAAGALKRAVSGLTRRSRTEQVERAVEPVETADGAVGGVAGALGDAIDKVPPGYFEGLCRMLADELGSVQG
jgi:hypothetical protein